MFGQALYNDNTNDEPKLKIQLSFDPKWIKKRDFWKFILPESVQMSDFNATNWIWLLVYLNPRDKITKKYLK